MIYHFQNHCYTYFEEFCHYLFSHMVWLPHNLQIVTCSNDEENSILIKQLRINHIPYINVVPQHCQWDNRDKIKYIIESLDQVNSKYVLILDANDVLLEGDLRTAVRTFLGSGKKLLYNATRSNYPEVRIGVIKDFKNRGKFRYLNAGCCIGYTEYAKKFYKHALKYLDIDNPWKSEQYIIRHAFRDRRKDVDFDWQCKIFQTVAGCIVLKKDNIWKVI